MGNVDRRAVDVAGHEREGLLASLQIFVVLRGGDIAVAVIVLLRRRLRVDQADAHQLFRMGKGKAAKHKGVDDRELRGHAPDAEGEHDRGEDAEGFLLEQNPEADTDVLAKSIEDHNEVRLDLGTEGAQE